MGELMVNVTARQLRLSARCPAVEERRPAGYSSESGCVTQTSTGATGGDVRLSLRDAVPHLGTNYQQAEPDVRAKAGA